MDGLSEQVADKGDVQNDPSNGLDDERTARTRAPAGNVFA
jgi:hypothetical protein